MGRFASIGPRFGVLGNRPKVSAIPGDYLLLVPQELRTADPSFATELIEGYLGLANSFVTLDGRSPFDVTPPSPEWEEALHQFTWLRHLKPAQEPGANEIARGILFEFISRSKKIRHHKIAPSLARDARRFIALITHSPILIDEHDARAYEKLMTHLNDAMRHLVSGESSAPDSLSRLQALIAIMFGGLAIANQEAYLDAYLPRLSAALNSQVQPDGGHVSRHPGVMIDVVLDLLPLRQCFAVRKRVLPDDVTDAIERAVQMLRFMRLGDGSIARFNGMSETRTDHLAAVLAYDERVATPLTSAPDTGYVRMQRRQSIVILDGAGPPSGGDATRAHAGALSFEMSVGSIPVIVNCGAPGPGQRDYLAISRSTPAHSTACVNDMSSATLASQVGSAAPKPDAPIVGPSRVDTVVGVADDGSATVRGQHDGYVDRLGFTHTRSLRLLPQGDGLHGVDRLNQGRRLLVATGSIPTSFAIHFHFHPDVALSRSKHPDAVDVELENGEKWRFIASGANIGFEDSVFLASLVGPYQAIQIVLRGRCEAETVVHWRFERQSGDEGTAAEARRRRFEVIQGSLQQRVGQADGDVGSYDNSESPAAGEGPDSGGENDEDDKGVRDDTADDES